MLSRECPTYPHAARAHFRVNLVCAVVSGKHARATELSLSRNPRRALDRPHRARTSRACRTPAGRARRRGTGGRRRRDGRGGRGPNFDAARSTPSSQLDHGGSEGIGVVELDRFEPRLESGAQPADHLARASECGAPAPHRPLVATCSGCRMRTRSVRVRTRARRSPAEAPTQARRSTPSESRVGSRRWNSDAQSVRGNWHACEGSKDGAEDRPGGGQGTSAACQFKGVPAQPARGSIGRCRLPFLAGLRPPCIRRLTPFDFVQRVRGRIGSPTSEQAHL